MKFSSFSSFALSQAEEVKSVGGADSYCCDIYITGGGIATLACGGSSPSECESAYMSLSTVAAVECDLDPINVNQPCGFA